MDFEEKNLVAGEYVSFNGREIIVKNSQCVLTNVERAKKGKIEIRKGRSDVWLSETYTNVQPHRC